MRIIHLPEVVSTNLSLREHLAAQYLPEGTALWTDFQTAGRGQMGNSWESEAGKNLTCSIVIYPSVIPASKQFLISQIAALAVKETLDAYAGGITIKWPNDIYWKDKKICGMLIENDLSGSTIRRSLIGIGINLNQEQFLSAAPNPVSLTQITGDSYDRERVLKSVLYHLFGYYLQLLDEKEDDIRRLYQNALYRNDGFYPYEDDQGQFDAAIETIEPTGHLILRLHDNSLRRYAFKEVRSLFS